MKVQDVILYIMLTFCQIVEIIVELPNYNFMSYVFHGKKINEKLLYDSS